MFGAAAFRGTASIEDYVDGIICNTGRAFGSAAARFCVHSLPALLALATAIALMRFSSPKTATFLTGVNVLLYSAPAVLAAEMLIYFLFFMWRHAAIIDGMRPVDALSFSSAFVRFRAGEVFSLLMLWLFYNLFIIIAPAAVYMAASGGGIFKSGAQAALGSLPLLLACAACGWIFFIFGSVYFHMASFALYENRSRVALAASAAE